MLGNDIRNLKVLGVAFDVRVTSSDGWIRLEGTDENIESARKVLNELEKIRRQGGEVTAPMFQLLVDNSRKP